MRNLVTLDGKKSSRHTPCAVRRKLQVAGILARCCLRLGPQGGRHTECACYFAFLALLCLTVPARAESAADAKAPPEKYSLRYQFHAGDTLRWNVVHRCQIRTAVSGTEQTAETTTLSVKVWRVLDVTPDGQATFEHRVESVDMRHRLSGRDEVHYNSNKDVAAPPGFENVAKAVGVPLAVITLDARGKVLSRKQNPVKAATPGQGEITIRLPEEPVAVGHQWSFPHDIDVPLPGGGVRRVKAVQSYTLEGVRTGVASIRMDTQILTPMNDPALESQLLQYETTGTVRFDVDAGRILGRQADVDKGVVGFRGAASSLHYRARSTEELVAPETKVAARESRR